MTVQLVGGATGYLFFVVGSIGPLARLMTANSILDPEEAAPWALAAALVWPISWLAVGANQAVRWVIRRTA